MPSMNGIAICNGIETSLEQARISILDRGFLFGDSVFEVMVAFHSQILDLQQHLERLRMSGEQVGLDIPWKNEELEFEIKHAVEKLKLPKAYIRLIISRGAGLSLFDSELKHPSRYLIVTEAKKESPLLYQNGISLKTRQKNSLDRKESAKTSNYLDSVVALQKIKKDNFDDVLWVNSEGEITECTTSNIFFLERQGDGVAFCTPPIQSGILKGITRSTLMTLCHNAQIPVREQIIFRDELPRFDEAFVCSTVRGLVPVQKIDLHKLATARQQSVFRHIERLFLTWVSTQIGSRVDWNEGNFI